MPKVYFPERKTYQGHEFKAGCIYDLREDPDGFVERWFKRGCSLVEDVPEDAEVLPDPRPLPEENFTPRVSYEEARIEAEPEEEEPEESPKLAEQESPAVTTEEDWMKPPTFEVQSRGGPYFNVVRQPDGRIMNEKALYRKEAEELAQSLSG